MGTVTKGKGAIYIKTLIGIAFMYFFRFGLSHLWRYVTDGDKDSRCIYRPYFL